MLGSMLTKEEVDEFMSEADVVRKTFIEMNFYLYLSIPLSVYQKDFHQIIHHSSNNNLNWL